MAVVNSVLDPNDPRFDSELRTAICDWLRNNSIDPALVLATDRPTCSYREGGGRPYGGHTISVRVKVQAGYGDVIRFGADRVDDALITKAMVVPPPHAVQAWLDATCATCGR
jgi:hypothetical protein